MLELVPGLPLLALCRSISLPARTPCPSADIGWTTYALTERNTAAGGQILRLSPRHYPKSAGERCLILVCTTWKAKLHNTIEVRPPRPALDLGP